MPVRFQVDGDFYDHPKTLGMSDAAVALWTRAGSYSVAKRTDGFIADHVLAILTKAPEAADELVTRDLWKRVKGGFKYHQWIERNLTKAKVEAFTEAARERKRSQRNRDKESENQQVNPENVTSMSRVTGSGVSHEGHADVTPLSLSVSVSSSESVSSSVSDGFAAFWLAYPKKVGKPVAEKAWKKAVKSGMEPSQLLSLASRYADRMQAAGTDQKYICNPSTWLNQERYNDEPAPAAAPVQRKYPPTEIPDWLDPNDPVAYSKWMTEAMR